MSFKRRVLAFTGIRSDYDLMSDVYKLINNDAELELGLIVAGAHLSRTYGYTIQNIVNDGLPIIAQIESLIDSDSRSSRLKSASILLQNCLHTVEAFKPDVILYAGDREDALVGAMAGAYLRIPGVHLFGGDHAVDGNVDNAVRHAVSKLASLHFVIHEQHHQRLRHIGESERRIFVIGNPSLDKFKTIPYINQEEILANFGCNNWKSYALLIFHPILGYEEMSGEFLSQIITALNDLQIPAFVSYPNVDPGNKQIIRIIEDIKDQENYLVYRNLDRNLFINVMRNAAFMIGNSSAGLLEAPSIPLGAVNVGERQKGRFATDNVIFVEHGVDEIKKGINTVLSDKFQNRLKEMSTIFGDGQSSLAVLKLIKELDFNSFIDKTEDPLYE